MGARRWIVVLVLGLTSGYAADLEGQRRSYRGDRGPRPSVWLGVDALGADPLGGFGEVVEAGWGLGLELHVPVAADGALTLRLDGGFLNYGIERTGLCLAPPVGCRIDIDLTTSNNIAWVGVGPELVAPRGAIRPYVNAAAGFSYFFTHSSLEGDDADSFGGTTNFDDLVGQTRFGGGFRTRLGRTVLLDLGAQYHRNGVVDYLREGDIVDHPDGSITLNARRSDANLIVYRIGLTFGLGGDRRHR